MKKKTTSRRRIDVNVEELDRIIEAAMQAPLNETDGRTLKTAVHAMAERLVRRRNTEKTSAVLEPKAPPAAVNTPEPEKQAVAGHGRNGAAAFTGANRVAVAHATLQSGDPCPECKEGRLYRQKEPATLIRIVGQPPLEATVFEMERLRCLCRMKHRQRYAASRTMPHRQCASPRPIRWQRGLVGCDVLRCGIIGIRLTGL